MRYAKIDKCEYTNGKECGISLYVSGCHFHCKGCFNSEAWDFNYGQLWNRRLTNQFFDWVSKDYVRRVSFLGGEPLADENVFGVSKLIKEIKLKFPNKKIWIFTGYRIEDIFNTHGDTAVNMCKISCILQADYIVDGQFEIDKKDTTLAFRGSSNQRVLSKEEVLKIWKSKVWKCGDIMRDTCWYCGGKLIWQSDFCYNEVVGECDDCNKKHCDGIATFLTCSDCGAEVQYSRECDDYVKE